MPLGWQRWTGRSMDGGVASAFLGHMGVPTELYVFLAGLIIWIRSHCIVWTIRDRMIAVMLVGVESGICIRWWALRTEDW